MTQPHPNSYAATAALLLVALLAVGAFLLIPRQPDHPDARSSAKATSGKPRLNVDEVPVEKLDAHDLAELLGELATNGHDDDVVRLLNRIDEHFLGVKSEKRSELAMEFERSLMLPLDQMNEKKLSEDQLIQRREARKRMGVAAKLYRLLLHEPVTRLLVAGRITTFDEGLKRAEPDFRNDQIADRLRGTIERPTLLQFEQLERALADENKVVLNDLLRSKFQSITDLGRHWELIADEPRRAGRLIGGMQWFWLKQKNKGRYRPIDSSALSDLLDHLLADHGIAVGAKFIAGMMDADPLLRESRVAPSSLDSPFSGAWSARWDRMMAEGGGFAEDLDWSAVYTRYLGEVVEGLAADEVQIAVKGLQGQLRQHRARMTWTPWDKEKKLAYLNELREAVKPYPALVLITELQAFWAMLDATIGKENDPCKLPEFLCEFLLADGGDEMERNDFMNRLLSLAGSRAEIRYDEASHDVLTRALLKRATAWAANPASGQRLIMAYTLRRDLKGEEWNSLKREVGRRMIAALPNIEDEEVKTHTMTEAIGLLLQVGENEEVRKLLQAEDGFMKGRQDLIRQLIQSGETSLAAPRSKEAFGISFRPPETYTEQLHHNLPAYLEKIEDPLLRFRAALAMKSARKDQEAKVPSRLQRLMPLAAQLGDVDFPDAESRWSSLLAMSCEPLAVTSGGAAQSLRDWGSSYQFDSSTAALRDRSLARMNHSLEAAYLGLLLREGRIEELAARLDMVISTCKLPHSEARAMFKNIVANLYEQSLLHVAEGRIEVVANCVEISRKLYQKMVQFDRDYTGTAHFWLEFCHVAAGRLVEVDNWTQEMGGRVAKARQQQVEGRIKVRFTPLSSVLSPAGPGLLERWDRPEHKDMRMAVMKMFFSDAHFRRICSKEGGRRLGSLKSFNAHDIQTLDWDEMCLAFEAWQKANPKIAHELPELAERVRKYKRQSPKRAKKSP